MSKRRGNKRYGKKERYRPEVKRIIYRSSSAGNTSATSSKMAKELDDGISSNYPGPPAIRPDFPGPSAFITRVNPPWTGNSFTVRNAKSTGCLDLFPSPLSGSNEPDYSWIQEIRNKEESLPPSNPLGIESHTVRIVVMWKCGHDSNEKVKDVNLEKFLEGAARRECPDCRKYATNVEDAVAINSDKWRKDD